MIVTNYRIKVHSLLKADFLSLVSEVQQLKEKLSKQDYLSHHKVKWLMTIKIHMKETIPQDPSHQDYFCANSKSVLKDYPNIRRKKYKKDIDCFLYFLQILKKLDMFGLMEKIHLENMAIKMILIMLC